MEDALGTVTVAGRDPTEPTAAPVVTVAVIAEGPGQWFDEVLTSLAAQDYPRLRIVVIDADPSRPELSHNISRFEERIRNSLADVEVILANDPEGFVAASNELLGLPGLSQFLLLCRDSVALAPDAIRRMVEEAVRSNAGILGPKLVEWDDERRIRHVGMAVDKLGEVSVYAEAGEFDQEQHDAVRDVFAVSGTAMLVRSDLFRALNGFDERMKHSGFDVDLCWRAHVAGARVMIVPTAVGRSRESADERAPTVSVEKLAKQAHTNRLRSMLSNYGLAHSLRVIPQAIVAAIVGFFAAIVSGRFGDARAIVGAWMSNVGSAGSIVRRRRALQRVRSVPDSEVRRFQVRGFETLNRKIRQRGEAATAAGGGLRRSFSSRGSSRELQSRLLVWCLVLATIGFGSRRLLGESVPVINQFGDFGAGPIDLIRGWMTSYRPTGFGTEGYAPTVEALVGIGGLATFGQMGLLRTLLTLGMIVLGAWGMYRLLAPFHSLFAQLSAPLVYSAVPLGYNALVNGSWRALVLLGGLPWILKWLVTAAGIAPFAPPANIWAWARHTMVAAVWVALVGAWAPIVVGAVAVIVLGVSLGGIFTGRPGPIWRLVLSGVFAIAGAFALHLPWSTELLGGDSWWAYFADGRAQRFGELSISQLIRFETGPHGGVPLGWALIVLAALSLLLSRSGRLVWAVRGWMMALLSFGVAWVEQRDELGFALPEPEVLLAPAALGIALAASMAVLSFERDLRRYGFGWRQALPAVAGLALVGSFIGGLGNTFDGGWDTPRNGFEIASIFLADGGEDQARVIWIGDADVLPVGSREFVDDLAISVTPARTPDVRDLFPPPLGAVGDEFDSALEVALRGGTSRLGTILGPLGIRYIIVVERIAPPYDTGDKPASPRVTSMLAEQLDLEQTAVRAGMTVYRNTAWVPIAASFPEETFLSAASPDSILDSGRYAAQVRTTLRPSDIGDVYDGVVRADSEVFLSVNATEEWGLRVNDTGMLRSRALGWANGFAVPDQGSARLVHTTPVTHRLMIAGQIFLWFITAVIILAGRKRS